jgi:hypothetical protein
LFCIKGLGNLNPGFLSLFLRDFSLSSQPFCLEKGRLALPEPKIPEIDYRDRLTETKQNKPRVQVRMNEKSL